LRTALDPHLGIHDYTGDRTVSCRADFATRSTVAIRAYRPGDEEALYEAVCESIPEVSRYETWCHPGYRREEAAQYVHFWMAMREKQQAYYFAVVERATGVFLGSCGLSGWNPEHRHAMLGYWIRTSRTGQGIATTAARQVARYGFEDLGLIRMELPIAVGNRASRRVAEKIGAVQEGISRNRLILPDGPVDVAIYGLLPGDFRAG
jgi:RimJ/RimL family protein N-acetyltransferase